MENLLPDPLQAAGLMVWFIVVYALLKKWLFEPYLDALDRRFADTGGAEQEFAQIRADIAGAEQQLKARLDAARSQAHAAQEKIVKAAVDQANMIVGEAQQAAQGKIAAAVADVDVAKAKVMDELNRSVTPLAGEAARRLTGAAA